MDTTANLKNLQLWNINLSLLTLILERCGLSISSMMVEIGHQQLMDGDNGNGMDPNQ